MWSREQEAEYLSLPEVEVVEPGRLERVAQEERAEEEVLERRFQRKVEVQLLDLHHWERPGLMVRVVGAEVLLLPPSLFLAVEPWL